MLIDPDVRGIAQYWGLDQTLVQAVVNAEGNIVRAVQCSLPSIQTREDALRVLCRSITHAMSDYVRIAKRDATPADFVEFFGRRWAPTGAKNDPNHLNEHWVPNVTKLWGVAA